MTPSFRIAFDEPDSEALTAVSAEANRPERVCPNCGAVLFERKCKLMCPQPACGYYMSCSDFY